MACPYVIVVLLFIVHNNNAFLYGWELGAVFLNAELLIFILS